MAALNRNKILGIILILIVTIGIIGVGLSMADPNSNFNRGIIRSLDEKQEKVLALVASSTGASFAVSLIPGDSGTAISQELAELSSLFAIALGAIFLEKYLLVIFQGIVFKFLLPIVAIAAITYVVTKKKLAASIAAKLFVFSLVLLIVIPVSEMFSNKVYSIYGATIDHTLTNAESKMNAVTDEINADKEGAQEIQEEQSEDKGIIDGLTDAMNGAKEELSNAASAVVGGIVVGADMFKEVFNNLLEALVIMLVTCCVLPILSLVLILMAAKYVLQLPINVTGTVNIARGKITEQMTLKEEKMKIGKKE